MSVNCTCDCTSILTNYSFSLNGEIYLFGGYDYTNGHYHDSIEVYQPKTGKWRTLACRIPQPLRSFGLCVLDDIVIISSK